jgi:hypothetical protein
MNEVFREHVEQLHPKFEALMRMSPVTLATLSKDAEKSGIYLLSEGPRHLYIGRSRKIRQRLRMHVGHPAGASFAVKLARELTGRLKPTYTTAGSIKELLREPEFLGAFQKAKGRIRAMHIRYIDEADCNRQALLEIYATVSLNTPYNDFETH